MGGRWKLVGGAHGPSRAVAMQPPARWLPEIPLPHAGSRLRLGAPPGGEPRATARRPADVDPDQRPLAGERWRIRVAVPGPTPTRWWLCDRLRVVSSTSSSSSTSAVVQALHRHRGAPCRRRLPARQLQLLYMARDPCSCSQGLLFRHDARSNVALDESPPLHRSRRLAEAENRRDVGVAVAMDVEC